MKRRQMRSIIAITLAVGMTLAACGCSKREGDDVQTTQPEQGQEQMNSLTDNITAEPVSGKPIDDRFVNAAADYSVDLFKRSVREDVEECKNVLISPESVLNALAMTANGADGETLAEMEQVISGSAGIPIDEFNSYMLTYNGDLEKEKNVKFNIANSIWIRDSEDEIRVNDRFLQTDKNYYDAEVFLRAFDDSTVGEINGWVNEKTDGMIDKLLDSISRDAMLYLINAVAFEGEWETPYEDAQIREDVSFTNASGEQESVTMLSGSENIYVRDGQATGFIKNYKGGKYAFMALLPNENISLEDYISGMTGESFINMYQDRSYEEVIVQLPEFSYEYEKELNDTLSDMGMAGAFKESADFSKMAETETDTDTETETDTGHLFIGKVLHKTFIQVDRHGTKAAAVTSVEIDNLALAIEQPKMVILDRPFVYAIVDTDTGLPIFLGAVSSVSQ